MLRMARKANIEREEIIMACWALLEQNYFPNIPRLTDYFINQDGRKCSNTTFLKAITEWEELYKERQDASFQELSDVFMPTFKKFERDISRDLQSLLEETLQNEDNSQALKRDATNGQYLSLSQLSQDQALEIDAQASLITTLTEAQQINKNKIEYLDKRYQETLSTVKMQQVKSAEQESQIKELILNLAQKEVDQTKCELQIKLLDEDRERLRESNREHLAQIERLTVLMQNDDLKRLSEQVEILISSQSKAELPIAK